jgi:RNA polymerase sigma-70 factor (ECF subfamily)
VSEHRSAPFSSLGTQEEGEATVDADRFLGGDSPFAGYWSIPPSRFGDLPEERLLAAETTELVRRAIAALPERQQQVISLRDVEGWDSDEVCDTLGITAANQRVLLHRARAHVRAVLESHLSGVAAA